MSAHPLVVVLDEEAETEQQCEYRIGFAAEQEKQSVPDGTVGEIEPSALGRCVGEGIKVEMLYRVEQDDAHDGEAAEHIGHVDACVASDCCRFHWRRMQGGCLQVIEAADCL